MNLLIIPICFGQIKPKLRKPMSNFPWLFPWSDSIFFVFLIWAEPSRNKNNNHHFVSVFSGIFFSNESGHSSQKTCFFCWEIVLNCMNKSLSDTREQEEISIQKSCDLCCEGGWQKKLALIVCFCLAVFCSIKHSVILRPKVIRKATFLF